MPKAPPGTSQSPAFLEGPEARAAGDGGPRGAGGQAAKEAGFQGCLHSCHLSLFVTLLLLVSKISLLGQQRSWQMTLHQGDSPESI